MLVYDLFEEQIRNYNDPFQKYIEQYGFIVLVIAYNKVMNFAKIIILPMNMNFVCFFILKLCL